MSEQWKTYIVEYPFDGSTWTFDVKARSLQEANERLKAIGWGKVVGTLEMSLPGWLPAWAISLYCRVQNWRGV